MSFNGIFLLSFALTSTLWANLLIRFLTGMFQIYICIFTPVWADTYGSEKLKNIWITVLLLSSPLGIFLGFMLTSLVAHAEGYGMVVLHSVEPYSPLLLLHLLRGLQIPRCAGGE
jgi:RsiW-degrading membrane proteinase PrsW (M82 family)